jgi:hypothetical protein
LLPPSLSSFLLISFITCCSTLTHKHKNNHSGSHTALGVRHYIHTQNQLHLYVNTREGGWAFPVHTPSTKIRSPRPPDPSSSLLSCYG